jgi:hypothetical protein
MVPQLKGSPMAFEITSRHIADFHRDGFVIFRDLLPGSLIKDLRAQAETALKLARERSPQAQRLQPLASYPAIDMKPFDDYHALPNLQKGLDALFGEAFGGKVDTHATRAVMGILFEPRDTAWCTAWHRDWRDNIRGLKTQEWRKIMQDLRYFNQVNLALYGDECTWVVPSSHVRDDTPEEFNRFPARPIDGPDLTGLDPVQAELRCMEYTTSLAGAVQARLNPGDYLLYRNSLWHIGNYVPYKKRATIHDGIFSAEFEAFFKNPPMKPKLADGSAAEWDNPNVGRPGFVLTAQK